MSEAITDEQSDSPEGMGVAIGGGAGMMLGAATGNAVVGLLLGAGVGGAYVVANSYTE